MPRTKPVGMYTLLKIMESMVNKKLEEKPDGGIRMKVYTEKEGYKWQELKENIEWYLSDTVSMVVGQYGTAAAKEILDGLGLEGLIKKQDEEKQEEETEAQQASPRKKKKKRRQ